MAYGKEYRGEWMMSDDTTTVRLSIYDTSTTVASSSDTVIVPMTMGPIPFSDSVIDNSKDKFTPGLKPKQATIQVITENGIDIATFTATTDLRWYVEAKIIGGDTIFKGFLVLADMQQPFLPDPNILTLTASDMLGSLRDVPLTDFSSATPTGPKRLIDLICYCLTKTGMNLNVYAAMNVRHGTGNQLIDYANFNSSGYIYFPVTSYGNFYAGQQLTVDAPGAANNGITYTVVTNNSGANIQVTPAPDRKSVV